VICLKNEDRAWVKGLGERLKTSTKLQEPESDFEIWVQAWKIMT
jgi:hypothetical protein